MALETTPTNNNNKWRNRTTTTDDSERPRSISKLAFTCKYRSRGRSKPWPKWAFIFCIKGTAWEKKTGRFLALIIGVKRHPAYGWWPRPYRCHCVITGPFGSAKGQLWARAVPEVQISHEIWILGGWSFFKNVWRNFLVLKVCVILITNFSLYM